MHDRQKHILFILFRQITAARDRIPWLQHVHMKDMLMTSPCDALMTTLT